MAIAFDSSLNNGTTSYSFTNTAGNFLALVVGTNTSTAPTATYGGTSLTFQLTQQFQGQSNWIHVFTLIAPATGSNTVAITGGSGVASSVATYSGVKQTGQPEVTAQGQASATSTSAALTTVTDKSWMITGFGGNSQPTYTNATARASNTYPYLVDSNSAITPAGSNTQTANWGGSSPSAWISIAIAPAPTGNKASFLIFM